MLSEKLANDIAEAALTKLQTKTAGLNRRALLAGLAGIGLGAATPALAQTAGGYFDGSDPGFMTSPYDEQPGYIPPVGVSPAQLRDNSWKYQPEVSPQQVPLANIPLV